MDPIRDQDGTILVGKVWWNKCGKFAVECLLGNLVFEIFSRRILVGKVEEGRGGGDKKRSRNQFKEEGEKV